MIIKLATCGTTEAVALDDNNCSSANIISSNSRR